MIVTVYKGINQIAPAYLCRLFQPRPGLSRCTLRGQHKMKVTLVKITTYGLKSFRYYAATHCNPS